MIEVVVQVLAVGVFVPELGMSGFFAVLGLIRVSGFHAGPYTDKSAFNVFNPLPFMRQLLFPDTPAFNGNDALSAALFRKSIGLIHNCRSLFNHPFLKILVENFPRPAKLHRSVGVHQRLNVALENYTIESGNPTLD
jgi:hypothetical protein